MTKLKSSNQIILLQTIQYISGKNGEIKVYKPSKNKQPAAATKTHQPSKNTTKNISQVSTSINVQGGIPISNGEETHQLDTEITEYIEVETSEERDAMIWLETEMESSSVVIIPEDDVIINDHIYYHP